MILHPREIQKNKKIYMTWSTTYMYNRSYFLGYHKEIRIKMIHDGCYMNSIGKIEDVENNGRTQNEL